FEKHAMSYFKPGLRVLEIGPDKLPSSYHEIVGDDSIQWETLDMSSYASAQGAMTYSTTSEYTFPIPDNSFDVVLSGQVIEHVRKIWLWVREVARVCKVGGVVITINPVNWPFHEYPIDCWRIYPDGMKSLYDDAGLRTELSVFESLQPY